jgi:glycosyltransferase involved in cell wall biosynthesis
VLTEHVGPVGYESRALELVERAAVASVGRASARLAEGLVTLNDKVEEELRRLAPGRPVARIPNGVDGQRYRPAQPGEREALRERLGWDERPRALFVGRLVAKKGVDLALAATARAGVELVVAGPGRWPDGAARDGVSLLGSQPPDRVAELYRAADVFLLPSRGEGFPVTAQEAMASGLPVLLADDPRYAPYVEGAGRGVTLAAAEPAELEHALHDLLRHPEALAAAGREAADHAAREYSWRRTADEHERFYEGLAAAR